MQKFAGSGQGGMKMYVPRYDECGLWYTSGKKIDADRLRRLFYEKFVRAMCMPQRIPYSDCTNAPGGHMT